MNETLIYIIHGVLATFLVLAPLGVAAYFDLKKESETQ